MKVYSSLLFVGTVTTTSIASAQFPDPIQTYFVPLPESELDVWFKSLNPKAKSPITSIISISIAADATLIYYDHWEDGFEANAKDRTQSSTEIWGDQDISNGAPPGVTTDAADFLHRGMVVLVEDRVPIPRITTDIHYDGGDRVQSSLPIVLVRTALPREPTGPLMDAAAEVYNTDQWGKRFIAPIGVNTPNLSGTWPFESAKFSVMAGEDNTQVTRNNKNNVIIGINFLDSGEAVEFDIDQGDIIISDRPVQVHLLTGDIGNKYELRWYALTSVDNWTNEYISPIAETLGNTGFWFYNASPSPIDIDYMGSNINSGSFSVAGNSEYFIETCTIGANCILVGTVDVQLGNRYSGVRFSSSNGPFHTLVQVDANDQGRLFDWGFSLIPTAQLTSQVLVGLGPGCFGSCVVPMAAPERNVVWVTPVAATTIYVDYDGDQMFDDHFVVTALSSLRLLNPSGNDGDMTGAYITSVSGPTISGQPDPNNPPIRIAVAWGQDPARSFFGDGKALDMGTAVLPLGNPYVQQVVESVERPGGSLDPGKVVRQAGDRIKYRITVSNTGYDDIPGISVSDPLIQNQVLAGTNAVLTGPVESFLNSASGILEVGETWIYTGTYTITAIDISSNGGGDSLIENSVTVSTSQFLPVTVEAVTPII